MSITYISHRKKANTGTRLFSALLFIFALSIACTFSLSAFGPYAFVASYHKAVFLISKSSYLVAPLVYFYVMSLLISDFTVNRDHLIHFVPFIAIELYSIFYLATLNDFSIWTASIEIITTFGILIQTTAYLVLITRLIRQHNINWELFKSLGQHSKQAWTRTVIVGFIFLWLVQMHSFVLLQLMDYMEWCGYTTSLYFMTAFLGINALAYASWKRPVTNLHTEKYKKSGLYNGNTERYKRELLNKMEEDELYLDPMLNQKKVAEAIGLSVPYLSQLINESFGQSFNDFVNQYRVERSKQLLADPAHADKNILEIAYETGFNSKTTFYTHFKKNVGTTPHKYRTSKLPGLK